MGKLLFLVCFLCTIFCGIAANSSATVILGMIDRQDNIWVVSDRKVGDKIDNNPKVVAKQDMVIGVSGDADVCDFIQFQFSLPKRDDNVESFSEYLKVKVVPLLKMELDKKRMLKEDCANLGRKYLNGQILIARHKEIHVIDFYFSVITIVCSAEEKFIAVGSGSNYAMGALAATMPEEKTLLRLYKALKVTEKLNSTAVAGPFDYVEITSNGKITGPQEIIITTVK